MIRKLSQRCRKVVPEYWGGKAKRAIEDFYFRCYNNVNKRIQKYIHVTSGPKKTFEGALVRNLGEVAGDGVLP